MGRLSVLASFSEKLRSVRTPEPRYGNSTRHWNSVSTRKHKAESSLGDLCQDLLVITDLEGKFLKVNPAWTATLGWHKSELLGNSSQWMIHPMIANKHSLRPSVWLPAESEWFWGSVSAEERLLPLAIVEGSAAPGVDLLLRATKRNKSMPRMACGEAQQELERVSRQTSPRSNDGFSDRFMKSTSHYPRSSRTRQRQVRWLRAQGP